MGTSFRGAFVISWAQTEVDGLRDASVAELHVGSGWAWPGEAVNVDGPRDVLLLNEAEGQANYTRVRPKLRTICAPLLKPF